MMKITFFIVFFLFFIHLSYGQFTGGNSDGNSNMRLTNAVCPVTNVNPFLGGNSDGHSNQRLTNVACVVVNVNPFTGGNADGHSNQRITNVVCAVVNVNPFTGGNADGHSNIRQTNVICTVTNVNPFLGGSADGIADAAITNVNRATCTSIVLPIELLSFTASCHDPNVIINWSTASETNNAFFTIEKSFDGKIFESIGKINAAGNSSQVIEYSFTDKNYLEGELYYRLLQTDYNGTQNYYNIVSAVCGVNHNRISIVPNPNLGTFVIKSRTTIFNVSISNALGEIIYRNTTPSSGYTIDFEKEMPNGVYFVELQSANSTIVERIVVNR